MKRICRRPYRERVQQWHSWFAWRPVRTEDGYCVWLARIKRIGRWNFTYGGDYWYDWTYKMETV